ncbi:uncharacterized protein JN550_004510 [Neoarthrinium moseri]|uniref:uncharacterized protein n=1 Tax=Neoarthrinium moseri TaxID=1658444 RepID=UPI001FDB7DB6|nr:uncharacterized protein JN550_004510 [Neoarthrinium moseri]KAI1871516.1 hypothetical protein JN550_004510 [Neoarthrinium moseri]
MSFSQSAKLILPVARCHNCGGGEDFCGGCRDINIIRVRRRWTTTAKTDEEDKDVFNKLFALRYGRESMNSALYHKYFGNFSLAMKWHRESLGQYIDAICEGRLEQLSLASTFIPTDAFSQLSTAELLDRCKELTRHLQKLHSELGRRELDADAGDDEDSVYSDVDMEEIDFDLFGSPEPVIGQLPTPLGSQKEAPTKGLEIRSKILKYWSADEDSRAYKFVRKPLHTPRFLAILLDLARHYSWEQTTRMVNYMVIERVRHFRSVDDKDRYPKLDDWKHVLDICSKLGFPVIKPEEIPADVLLAINFRMTNQGLVKEGNSFSPYADKLGICLQRGATCMRSSTGPHIFRVQYITRCSPQDVT